MTYTYVSSLLPSHCSLTKKAPTIGPKHRKVDYIPQNVFVEASTCTQEIFEQAPARDSTTIRRDVFCVRSYRPKKIHSAETGTQRYWVLTKVP